MSKEVINSKDGLVPYLYSKKEECCGCTACYAICPQEAIMMVEDEEGFFYPEINVEKCIRCEKCLKVCPIKMIQRHEGANNIM